MLARFEVVDLGRTQQGQITHIRQRADVQYVGVGQRIPMPEPHLLLRGLARQLGHLAARHDPDVPFRELGEPGVAEWSPGTEVGQVVRRQGLGHRVLVFDAGLVGLE